MAQFRLKITSPGAAPFHCGGLGGAPRSNAERKWRNRSERIVTTRSLRGQRSALKTEARGFWWEGWNSQSSPRPPPGEDAFPRLLPAGGKPWKRPARSALDSLVTDPGSKGEPPIKVYRWDARPRPVQGTEEGKWFETVLDIPAIS